MGKNHKLLAIYKEGYDAVVVRRANGSIEDPSALLGMHDR